MKEKKLFTRYLVYPCERRSVSPGGVFLFPPIEILQEGENVDYKAMQSFVRQRVDVNALVYCYSAIGKEWIELEAGEPKKRNDVPEK